MGWLVASSEALGVETLVFMGKHWLPCLVDKVVASDGCGA